MAVLLQEYAAGVCCSFRQSCVSCSSRVTPNGKSASAGEGLDKAPLASACELIIRIYEST